jgi:ribosomal protection tetracycline resistance protein
LASTLNLGILAHVDAGKTSLTERLLFTAGITDEIGSVDAGSTQTDTLALERQRGITIKSAVVSFPLRGVTVNLVDTPGHPDFIAEVERVLGVLDGAVLVISAVEGVQAQTRVLLRTLRRLHIPTLLFINKIDRLGARYDGVLEEIAVRLTPGAVPMNSVSDIGTRNAAAAPLPTIPIEPLAENNEMLMKSYVDNSAISYQQLHAELAAQTRQNLVFPTFFGSAITGAGADNVISGITQLLPTSQGDPDGPLSGTVFKIDRGTSGEKVAYVRMFSGTIAARDRLRFGADKIGKVTSIGVFDNGAIVPRSEMTAGSIGKLTGLADIRIGDSIGEHPIADDQHYFRLPTLETVLAPRIPAEKGALHVALEQLAEQDPLINLRQDDVRQEMSVCLYGEVQKEVIEATLAEEYGLAVTFRETTIICAERVVGTGSSVDRLGGSDNPFLAGIGLRIEPGPPGSGIQFRVDVGLQTIPMYVYKEMSVFRRAMTDTIRKTLRQGLFGWQIIDCIVTLTHSDYTPPGTGSGDLRYLTPLVLMDALKLAKTVVCEPINRFRLEFPPDTLGAILPALGRLRAVPATMGDSTLEGEIPADHVHDLEQQLPGLTRGEGVVENEFARYAAIRGSFPTRPRTDDNPLNRKEYLLRVLRRVATR